MGVSKTHFLAAVATILYNGCYLVGFGKAIRSTMA